MKKYKLIKTYPGSPELGTIASRGVGIKFEHPNGNVSGFSSSKCKDFESLIENQPEFWEEIIEKEYEILSFKEETGQISVLQSNGKYYDKNGTKFDPNGYFCGFTIDQEFKNNAVIHSVKRLSDGEVFTVGDIVEQYKNRSFKISYFNKGRFELSHMLYANSTDISVLKKIKKPLFTSEDGVDIYEGDEYFEVITPDFHNEPCIWNIIPNKTRGNIIYDQVGNKKNGRLWFSNKESAEEYILVNKPCLSIADIYNHFNGQWSKCSSIVHLKELVKSKL